MMIYKYISIAIITIFSVSAYSTEDVTIDKVVEIVSVRNYQVLESAEKVYQARAEIAVARGNLLPKLNFWSIIKSLINPASLVETILSGESGIAPFLVPNNWFRFTESQILFDAEKESYRGVWSNEVLNAKSIYYDLLLDQKLYDLISGHVDEIEGVFKVAKTREALGSLPFGTAQELEIRWLKLKDDKEVLSKLILDEYKALTLALGIPFKEEISMEDISLPKIKDLKPLNYSDFEFRVVDSAPEKRQLDHLLRVIPYLKKEVKYSFFGNSKASRGVAGGIFDDIPIPDGFGYGNGPAISIIEGQERIFNLQKTGVIEVLKRQLYSVVNNYNSSIERYPNLERRLYLAESRVKQYLGRLQIGEDIDLIELTDAYHRNAFEKMGLATLEFRFVINEDKFQRLIFHGDYKKYKGSLQKIDEQRKAYMAEVARLAALEKKEKLRDKRRRP